MNWLQVVASVFLGADVCLRSQVLVSCLYLPCSHTLPLLCHPPSLGRRRGFLKRGLSSGKTLWPAASVSYNSTNHMVRREDLQKDRDENRKIKWVEGKKKTSRPWLIDSKEHLGESWGKELPLFPQWLLFSLSPCFFFFSHLLLPELQGFSPGVWVE